jgi:hypothetical protein
MRRSYRRLTVFTVMVIVLGLPALAAACSIQGDITASISSRPCLGDYEYTLTMDWNTETITGLQYFEMFMDALGRRCLCSELQAGVVPGDTVGFSMTYDDRAIVYYESEFLCDGDPLVTDMAILLRFAPLPSPIAPGSFGEGHFTFYSDFPPAEIEYSSLYLVDSSNTFLCEGNLRGVFPSLPCDPLPAETDTWGGLKSRYHR